MKTNYLPPQIENIPVISFFTGGGFLDIGFEQAGFSVVWSNEANPVFAGLYSYGMTKWKQSRDPGAGAVSISSVRKIEDVSAKKVVISAFPFGKPALFGVIGGPPCPDFSVGGKNRGGKGINGRLSETYINRIRGIKPSFFIFENVPGLYKIKKHRGFLKDLEDIAEGAGYCIDLKLLNALEFGVPQDRERLIMIGIKRNLAQSFLGRKIPKNERGWFCWPEPRYENVKEKYQWPAIAKKGRRITRPSDIPMELTVHSILNTKNDPARLPNGRDCFKAYSKRFKTIREGDTARKSFKRLHRYRFSPTACYGHNEVHLHPWHPRRLSVREAMRIQGVPDTYELPPEASLTSKYSIVSNGVPVPLALEVAKSLRKFLDKGNYHNVTTETENSLKLYEKVRKALVGNSKKR